MRETSRGGGTIDLEELEESAKQRLGTSPYDYYAGGADDESTLTDNVAAWRRIRLRPRVLRDVSQVTTRTTLVGTSVSSPIAVAPTAYHAMAHERAEAETARGAAAAGCLLVVSTLSTVSLADVAAAAPRAPRWLQLYVRGDRGWTEEVIARGIDAGCEAIVVTVDLPVVGHRPRDHRNAFSLQEELRRAEGAVDTGSALMRYAQRELDASLAFGDIDWIRACADGRPVLVKGVLRADDAVRAVEAGADGVVVSNHGGRQLDTAVATADALSAIADAVGDQTEVLVDGGIRRGTDVLKALAMGARGVFVGRPILWGLTTSGADGVTAVIEQLKEELERAMMLSGATELEALRPDLLVPGR